MIDTATVLQLRAGVDALLRRSDRHFRGLQRARTTTSMRTATVARTLLQHALPMPFGHGSSRIRVSPASLASGRLEANAQGGDHGLQFGSAGGTLAALGADKVEDCRTTRQRIIAPLPDALPWHTTATIIAEAASVFAILAGTSGRSRAMFRF
jgi:3-carboxy-cis,cis-muconate cycloisomerase